MRNSASGNADAIDPAQALRDAGCDVREATLDEATQWAASPGDGDLDDIQRVAVAGGDGSVGCAALLARAIDVPLAVLPMGTANDAARALGLPDDLEVAVQLAAGGTTVRAIDLCDFAGSPFVNVASIGISGTASQYAEPLKRYLGPVAYPVGALMAAIRSRPHFVAVQVDGEEVWRGDVWQLLIAGTGKFGGVGDTGGTIDGDGELDVFVLPADRGSRVVLDASALTTGSLGEREGVVHARGREVCVTTRHRHSVIIDGERRELHHGNARVQVLPRRLDVVVPAS